MPLQKVYFNVRATGDSVLRESIGNEAISIAVNGFTVSLQADPSGSVKGNIEGEAPTWEEAWREAERAVWAVFALVHSKNVVVNYENHEQDGKRHVVASCGFRFSMVPAPQIIVTDADIATAREAFCGIQSDTVLRELLPMFRAGLELLEQGSEGLRGAGANFGLVLDGLNERLGGKGRDSWSDILARIQNDLNLTLSAQVEIEVRAARHFGGHYRPYVTPLSGNIDLAMGMLKDFARKALLAAGLSASQGNLPN